MALALHLSHQMVVLAAYCLLLTAIARSRSAFWIQRAQPFGLGGLEKLPVGGDEQHRLLQGLL